MLQQFIFSSFAHVIFSHFLDVCHNALPSFRHHPDVLDYAAVFAGEALSPQDLMSLIPQARILIFRPQSGNFQSIACMLLPNDLSHRTVLDSKNGLPSNSVDRHKVLNPSDVTDRHWIRADCLP